VFKVDVGNINTIQTISGKRLLYQANIFTMTLCNSKCLPGTKCNGNAYFPALIVCIVLNILHKYLKFGSYFLLPVYFTTFTYFNEYRYTQVIIYLFAVISTFVHC